MRVETRGDSWKVVKRVLIFIYTPVIFISLASKQAKIELSCLLSLSSVSLLHFQCRICSYFVGSQSLPQAQLYLSSTMANPTSQQVKHCNLDNNTDTPEN